jgi:hypothetical protein
VLTAELVAQLGIVTTARDVVMTPDVLQHIVDRRAVVSRDDVDLAANRLHEALAHPCYLEAGRSKPTVWEVIGFVPSAGRHVLVALKFLRASSDAGQDAWWVQTAHPFGSKTLRTRLARGELTALGSTSCP